MYRILLADDEHLEREALKLIITENLVNASIVGEAASGTEVVIQDQKLNPDIIFMDIKMPEMDGIKASKKIKEKNRDRRIILLTAYDEFNLAQQAIKIGIDDYILKPAAPNEILDALSKQIENINKTKQIGNNKKHLVKSKEIKVIIDYINNNYNKEISLDKVSKMVNLDQAYISKLFKKEIGINFVAYVTEQKINRAKNLLANTDIPILNIALDLGYKNSNYFCRVFKKLEDVSPSEYRKNKFISDYS